MSLLLLFRGPAAQIARRPQLSPHKKLQRIQDARGVLGHGRACSRAAGFTVRVANPPPATPSVFRAPAPLPLWAETAPVLVPTPVPQPLAVSAKGYITRVTVTSKVVVPVTRMGSGLVLHGPRGAAMAYPLRCAASSQGAVLAARATARAHNVPGRATRDYADEYAMLLAGIVA